MEPRTLLSTTFYLTEGSAARVLIPANSIGTSWTSASFTDSTWKSGVTGVGYENSPDDAVNYTDMIGLALLEMLNVNSTCYVRVPFSVADPAAVQALTLRMKYDDGFVAYINGTEVARRNAPTAVDWQSAATAQHPDSEAIVFETIGVSSFINALTTGSNVLAIQGLNITAGSSDFVISPELEATVAEAPVGQVAVSEIMYNPSAASGKDLEYLELVNPTQAAINVGGYHFTAGIAASVPAGTLLAAGGRLVLARTPADVQSFFGISGVLAYTGSLDNSGEQLRLETPTGGVVFDFSYDDEGLWPIAADGAGQSLVIVNSLSSPAAPANWMSSQFINGSPGTVEPASTAGTEAVLNEVLAAPTAGQDFVELANPTAGTLNLGGYGLSNDPTNLGKFVIPAGTNLAPGGHLVFQQSQLGFGLDQAGDSLFLTNPARTRVVDATKFGAVLTGISVGRFPDATGDWGALRSPTSGATNQPPVGGDIVINEIMFHPPDSLISPPIDNLQDEYVELYNPGNLSVNLGGWYFSGIDFTFPAGTNLGAGQYLLVVSTADTSSFRSRYTGVPAGVTVLGGFGNTSKLSNSGETLRLLNSLGVEVDQVSYGDYAPWPTLGDNNDGAFYRSIELIEAGKENDSPRNWADSPRGGTPGRQNTAAGTSPAWIDRVTMTEDLAAPGPNQPPANANIIVTARVQGGVGATLTYIINNWGSTTGQQSLPMFDDGGVSHGDAAAGDGIYSAIIPPQAPDTFIRYRITATSIIGGADPQSPIRGDTNQWYGTVVWNPAIQSQAPVYYWLRDPATFQVGSAGTTAFFYDGQYYENVSYTHRGNVSDSPTFWKRHYKFFFPTGHPFEYVDLDGERHTVSSFRVSSALEDKTYARQFAAFDTFDQTGVPAPQAFNIRLQMGNQFFGSYVFIETPYEDMLSREGMDPNGTIYKPVDSAGFNPTHATSQYYEKNTRQWDTSYQDLADFFTGLQAPAGSTAAQEFLFNSTDVAKFVDYMAVFALVDGADNIKDKNFILYHDNDGTGWWSPVPWDMDTAFGGQIFLEDGVAQRNTWGTPGDNDGTRLWNRLYTSPQILQMIQRRVRTLTDQLLGPVSARQNWFEDHFDLVNDIIDPGPDYYYKNWNASLQPQVPDQNVNFSDGLPNLPQYVTTDVTLDQDKWGWKDIANWRPGFPADATHHAPTYYYTLDDEIARVKSRYLDYVRGYLYAHPMMPSAQASTPGMVQINAVTSEMLRPASGNPLEQYLVLHNPTGNAVDLSGWTLSGPGFTFILAGGTVLTGGADVYVAADPASFLARATGPHGGQGLFVVGGWTGALDANGGTISLMASDQTAIDASTYSGQATAAQQQLRITELMYHPVEETGPYTADDFEFIEVRNVGAAPLAIGESALAGGIDFTFPAATLQAGEFAVVVKNPSAFASRYPNVNVAGTFSGSLSNSGEQIQLFGPEGEAITDFTYSDAWYPVTDGDGNTLVVVDPQGAAADPANWRASRFSGGSPGADESTLATGAVVINEVMANSTDSSGGWIELRNTTSNPIDIGGWYLSDSSVNLTKYQIPSGTVLAAGGYVVFNESTQFGNPAAAGVNVAFSLGDAGDSVIVASVTAGGALDGYRDEQQFGASEVGASFGRYVPSIGSADFVLQTTPTKGSANAAPAVGPLVIDQIMYDPAAGGDEYVRLRNISSTTLSLFDPAHPANTWQFTAGIDFAFPGGSSVAPGGYVLVVGSDPAAFRTKYSIPAIVQIFGPFTGVLDNAGEAVELSRPGAPQSDQSVPQIVVEHVRYGNVAPWPLANGNGSALARITGSEYGNDPVNWTVGTVADLPIGSMRGSVFNDVSGEGVRAKAEKGLAKRRVFIDANGNGKLDADERSVVTDSAGRYLFDDVMAGSYSVRPAPAKGWRVSSPSSGAYATVVAGGTATNVRDFAFTQKALISGTVFADKNGNKIKDTTEKGMQGFRVYIDLDNDGVFDSSEPSALTDKLGAFSFKTLAAGKYAVRILAKSPYKTTTPAGGVYKLTLKAGGVATARNFGQK